MALISGLSKFYANSMSALRFIEYYWEKKMFGSLSNNLLCKCIASRFCIHWKIAKQWPNNTLRRPNNDIWRFQGWPVSILAFYIRKNFWLLNIKCPWMIHCTNLKRFPQYLKCPRANHSITSDENSPRPPCERPGLPSRGPASLGVTSSVSK